MEPSQPDAADDNAMDSFLDKFQSQPYRGGFHEDQWEEVGGPGDSARVWGRPPDSWGSAESPSCPGPCRCQRVDGF